MTDLRTVDHTFATRVHAERQRHGWTLRELAARSGVSYQHIGQIERLQYRVSLCYAVALARAFGLPLDVMIDEVAA